MSEPVWKTMQITFMASASQDAELFAAFTDLIRAFHESQLYGKSFPVPLDRAAVARCALHLHSQFADALRDQRTGELLED